ncbi:MAG: hypothetical protein Q9202_003585 [Teloschistes flavicans]
MGLAGWTTISDLVLISPEDLQKPSAESIEDNINAKYANKVGAYTFLGVTFLSNCISTKVVQKVGLCVCLYDILTASDGLIGHGTGILNVNVSLDFFDDIFVPSNLLFPESTFNGQEQCWVWSNEGQEYFYDKTDWVRFRVEQEHWTDLAPVAPSERDTAAMAERKSPYSITSVGTIKWRYELVVDDDGVGILRKRGLDAMGPKDEWKMPPPPSPRYSASVEAHYRFFKMIYDCPIDIPVREGPEAVLENLSELVAVGDLYGGLDLLANAIEKFMGRYIGWFLEYFYLQGPAILGIAMRLKIVWLFKDMVCLACGDITRNSDRVRRDYEPIAASIILKKRKELRQMMTEINHDLLTMSTPKVEATSSKLLVAAFREMMIQMVKFTESKGWDQRGLIYSKDPAFYSLHQDCSERDKVTELDTVEEITFQDAKLCQKMGRDAAALTGPLYLNCLSELSSHGRNEGDTGGIVISVYQ